MKSALFFLVISFMAPSLAFGQDSCSGKVCVAPAIGLVCDAGKKPTWKKIDGKCCPQQVCAEAEEEAVKESVEDRCEMKDGHLPAGCVET